MVPFPVGPSDVLYCRFLLTHLREPGALLAAWGTQLRPRGRLLVEEAEWIRTRHPTFAAYLDIVEGVLASESKRLYVGPTLDALGHVGGLTRATSAVARLPVSNRQAAGMFFLNAAAWKDHAYVRARHDPAAIGRLEEDLRALAATPGAASDIEWGLRQLVFERR